MFATCLRWLQTAVIYLLMGDSIDITISFIYTNTGLLLPEAIYFKVLIDQSGCIFSVLSRIATEGSWNMWHFYKFLIVYYIWRFFTIKLKYHSNQEAPPPSRQYSLNKVKTLFQMWNMYFFSKSEITCTNSLWGQKRCQYRRKLSENHTENISCACVQTASKKVVS